MHILAQWRDDIAKGVSEGNDEETYANTLLPSPKTEAEKVAMRLIHFEKIDSKSPWLAGAADKTKEEKAAEITHWIVLSTKISEPIKVTYLLLQLPSDAESSCDDNSEMTKTSRGTAVKEGENNWYVSLDNNKKMSVTDNDLMDGSKFYVEQLSVEQDESKRRKQSAKRKRTHQTEQFEKEKKIREKGLEKLREIEYQEYNNLCERFKSGEAFQFEEFLAMVDRIRKPLVCQIEGHEVSLMQDDCAIMMETLAVHAIIDSLFVEKEMQNGQGNMAMQQQNK